MLSDIQGFGKTITDLNPPWSNPNIEVSDIYIYMAYARLATDYFRSLSGRD